MVYATKEKYNQYMREYMKNKRAQEPVAGPRRSAGRPSTARADDDFTELSLDSPAIQKGISHVKELTKDPLSGEEDKIILYIEKFAKYAPLVKEIISQITEGFKTAAEAARSNNPQQQQVQQPRGAQPPPGWLEMAPLDKLKRKHSMSDWYNAGVAYDQFKINGTQAVAAVNYVDPTYTPRERKVAAAFGDDVVQSERGIEPQKKDASGFLAKLKESGVVVTDNVDAELVSQTQSETTPSPSRETGTTQESEGSNSMENQQQIDPVTQKVQQELLKVIEYLNKLDEAKFREYCRNPKPLILLLTVYKSTMMDKVMVQALDQSTPEELYNIFVDACPIKLQIVQQEHALDTLMLIFSKLTGKIKTVEVPKDELDELFVDEVKPKPTARPAMHMESRKKVKPKKEVVLAPDVQPEIIDARLAIDRKRKK